MQPIDADQNRPTLLLTRPKGPSARFAAGFRGRFGADWPVVISPLMRIEFLTPALDPSAYQGVIFSSENGVAAYAAGGNAVPRICHCVGQRAAAAALALGWRAGLTAPNAEGLAQALLAARVAGPLLHLHGRHRAGNLAQTLISAGTETVSAVIYDQITVPPTTEALALLRQPRPVLVPLFSPRSAQLFQQAATGATSPLWIAALSPAVATALTLQPAQLGVAAAPDGTAMLDALEMLLRPVG